jgi:hypothetical protein
MPCPRKALVAFKLSVVTCITDNPTSPTSIALATTTPYTPLPRLAACHSPPFSGALLLIPVADPMLNVLCATSAVSKALDDARSKNTNV